MSNQRWYCVALDVSVVRRRHENVMASSQKEAVQKAVTQAKQSALGSEDHNERVADEVISVRAIGVIQEAPSAA